MKNKHRIGLLLLAVALTLCASASWSAVGIYKWSADEYLPANINYMLSGNVASVTINMVPKGLAGPVVWTVTYTSPDPMTVRGAHTASWAGTGGTPGAQYDAIVTAVGNVMPAGTLTPLWEVPQDWAVRRYPQVAMNTRVPTPGHPNPYYGRIYACNNLGPSYRKVEMWNPDGSYIGVMDDAGISWGSVWGVAIDEDDHVWISDRINKLFRFDPDGTGRLPAAATGWPWWLDPLGPWPTPGPGFHLYSRGLAVTGSGSTFKVADSHWGTSQYGLMYGWGENAGGIVNGPTGLRTLFSPVVLPALPPAYPPPPPPQIYLKSYQPFFTPAGKLLYPGYAGLAPTSLTGGIMEAYLDASGAAINTGITRPTCIQILPDGSYLVGRYAQGDATDGTIAFYQFAPGTDLMIATDASATAKLTLTSAGLGNRFPHYMIADKFGSVLAAANMTGEAAASYNFGLYSMPDSGVTVTQIAGTIYDAFQPRIISVIPSSVTVPSDGTTIVPVDVSLTDLGGYADITGVAIVAPYGAGGTTTFTGTRISGSGNDAVYRVNVSAQPGDQAGIHNAVVRAYSSAPVVEAPIPIRVTDATIQGTVSASVASSFKIAGVTVTATDGPSDIQTAVTDANGFFSMDATGGKTYQVSAAKDGWTTGAAVPVTPTHFGTSTQDFTLAPLNMRDVVLVGGVRRINNTHVAVVATVLRQSYQAGRNGTQGFYFLTDSVSGAQYGCLVYQQTTHPFFNEGDRVLVEGTWIIGGADKDGYLVPAVAVPPVLLSSGNSYADPVQCYFNDIPYFDTNDGRVWGHYVKVDKVKVLAASAWAENPVIFPAGVTYRFSAFNINVPTSATDLTPLQIKVEIDTKNSTITTPADTVGCYYPAPGDWVNVKGITGWTDVSYGYNVNFPTSNVIKPGKPSDVEVIPPTNLGAAKDLPDGDMAIVRGPVVTVVLSDGIYVETPDRTSGIRIKGTLPTGVNAIGFGDMIVAEGVMDTTASGERFIDSTGSQYSIARSAAGHFGATTPLVAMGMNNRDASQTKSLGLFVKIWGKVASPLGTDNFVISDGSAVPITVMCGTLTKPAVGDMVRVRGVMSMDASGPVLLMRNEQCDWTLGSATYEKLPFPGAFKYPSDFLVLGPFQDPASLPPPEDPNDLLLAARRYRLDNDFISAATGGTITELTLATAAPPQLGGTLAGRTWTRSDGIAGHVAFAPATPPAELTNCTFYAHVWVYASADIDALAMRVGSDDSSMIIVTAANPELGPNVYYTTTPVVGRPETWGQDSADGTPLSQGWNSVLLKCENGTSGCGMDIQFVAATGVADWGGATPLEGLSYSLDKPTP